MRITRDRDEGVGIDLYQYRRHDPDVPFESVSALAELKREGKIRHVGVSNVGVEQLENESPVMLPIPGTSSVAHAEELFSWTP